MRAAALAGAACLLAMASCARSPVARQLSDGEAHLAAGEVEAAQAAYRRALSLAPADETARRGLARAHLAASEPAAAMSNLEGLEAPELRCRARKMLAAEALAAVAPGTAIAQIDAATGEGCAPEPLRPLLVRAHRLEAAEADRLGDADARLAALLSAIDADPVDEEASSAFADAAGLLLEHRRVPEAVELLDRALAVHPRDRRLIGLMVAALGGVSPEQLEQGRPRTSP